MNPIKLAAPTREPHYLVRIGAESRGPYDVHALETLALNQTIAPTTLLALEGSTDFKPATEWPFFEQVFPAKTWSLAKGPADFAVINEKHKAPQAGSEPPKDNPRAGGRTRAIGSMKELQARTAADPFDPVITATMNEATFRMKEDGVTQEKALKRIFAANRELNRNEDRISKYSQTTIQAALFRRTATKYAITLALLCLALMYYYKESQSNGLIALCIIGVTYGTCLFSAGWIVKAHYSVQYLMTAIELYLCFWAVWVTIAIIRDGAISDPFLALFNCLTSWHH
jgi:hypothetical protein